MDAVRVLFHEVLPTVTVVNVDESLHTNAVATFLGANGSDLSLVDCVSFTVMRQRGVAAAFAFDRHLAEQGFGFV